MKTLSRRQYLTVPITAVMVCFGCVQVTQARYDFFEIKEVPVSRLVANLTELAKTHKDDVRIRYNLARLHAMAFALKVDTVKTDKSSGSSGAWFGVAPKYVPFKVVKTEDREKNKIAEKHLAKAIDEYTKVVEAKPRTYFNLRAQLGLAWCIEQTGDKKKAIDAYRRVIARSWIEDGARVYGRLSPHYITSEAASYLIPLLNAKQDATEIATLEARSKRLARLHRTITPVAIPLVDGMDAQTVSDCKASVSFDADGSGIQKKWTWIHRDAGFLVYDRAGQGKITSSLQLFGNVTFWLFWENGYKAMGALDDNQDGWLRGTELQHLYIWRDANGNAISESGEVKPLADWNIVGLSCRWKKLASHPEQIPYSPAGVQFRDGTVRPSFDINLHPVPVTKPRSQRPGANDE